MSEITTVGIDLAKNVFSVHGVDEDGVVIFRKTVSRTRLASMVAQWPTCLIGMACSGAHDWARRFQALGHTVRIMASRFVPVKSAEQQAVLTLHRVRQGFVEERTATINRIRGLLAEFGATNDRGPSARLTFGPGAHLSPTQRPVIDLQSDLFLSANREQRQIFRGSPYRLS